MHAQCAEADEPVNIYNVMYMYTIITVSSSVFRFTTVTTVTTVTTEEPADRCIRKFYCIKGLILPPKKYTSAKANQEEEMTENDIECTLICSLQHVGLTKS